MFNKIFFWVFAEFVWDLMEIGCMLELWSFFVSDYPFRSAADKQRAGRVSAKSSFFFSLKSKLHQLSVMSCQESCSSKECIEESVPTLHFTSQHDHRATGVLSDCFSIFSLSTTDSESYQEHIFICAVPPAGVAQKIHMKVWMRKN